MKSLGMQYVAIVHTYDTYGRESTRVLKQHLGKQVPPICVASTSVVTTEDAASFTAAASNLQTSRAKVGALIISSKSPIGALSRH